MVLWWWLLVIVGAWLSSAFASRDRLNELIGSLRLCGFIDAQFRTTLLPLVSQCAPLWICWSCCLPLLSVCLPRSLGFVCLHLSLLLIVILLLKVWWWQVGTWWWKNAGWNHLGSNDHRIIQTPFNAQTSDVVIVLLLPERRNDPGISSTPSLSWWWWMAGAGFQCPTEMPRRRLM